MSFRVAEGFVEVSMDRAKYDASLAKLKGQKLDLAALVKLDDAAAKAQLKALVRPLTIKLQAQVDDAGAKAKTTALGRRITAQLVVAVDDTAAKAKLADLARSRTAKLTVQADDTAAKAKIAALSSGARSINVALAFDRAKAQASLDSLGGKLKVKVEPTLANYTTYLTQIQRLTRDQRVNITLVIQNLQTYLMQLDRLTRDQFVNVNPRLKSEVYLRQLDRLTRDQTIDVRTNLVVGDARVRLDALTRNRRVRVDVDSQGLTGLAGMFSRIGGGASGASGGISMLGGRMTALVVAAMSAAPTLVSLGQAIISMGPAAAIAAPALGSLLSIFGALKLGLGGIGAAFKHAFAPAAGGASAAGAATHAVADAQTALKIAVRDAADSNRHAIQAVAAAERDLADAQRAEKQAQLDLSKARKEAQQQLDDYQQQLVDGELDHRQALLDVDQAKADLDKTLADPTATDLQKQQAQLAYDQAVQHLKEQEIAQQRLKDEAAAAAQAGVDGNDKVQQAVQGVSDAEQGLADKEQALSEARISQAEAAEDGAIRVAQAQQAVADAMQSTGGAAGGAASAISKLAPAAREFVNAVIALKPAWDAMKLDVQQTLFKGLAGQLTSVAHQVLPDLRVGLVGTAGVLNQIARNALDAIGNLSKTGTLKTAFAGINEALSHLGKVPAQLITMFGQLTAAAGPAFGRVTQLISDVVGSLSTKLGAAFKSGALTEAINGALNLVGQFAKLLGDVLGTVGNVLKAAGAAGGDALGMLGAVFGELRKVTASPEVQGALTALFATFQKLATTVAPLVGLALKELGPVIEALAPPVQMLVSNLGAALQPIIAALGPVLLAAANAVGALLNAVSPLLPVVGNLIAQLGPAIAPIFEALAKAFEQAAPVVAQLGQVISSVLAPVLAQLPLLMQPLMALWLTWQTAMLPVVSQLLIALQPALQQLGNAFVQIMIALAPVLVQLGNLLAQCLPPLMKILTPIIGLVGQLASIFAGELAKTVEQIVVPALRMVTQLLHGDFSGAFDSAKQVVKGMINMLIDQFVTLPVKIVSALGDLGRTLWNAGTRLLSGLIDGIWSKLGDLRRALSSITDMLPDWKGPAEKDATILGPSGQLLIEGLMGGIASRVPALRAQLQGITGEIGATPIGMGAPSITSPGAVIGVTTSLPAQAAAPTLAPTQAGSTVTIQNLTVSGTWDLSSAADRTAAANAMVGEIKEALRAYDRGRAR